MASPLVSSTTIPWTGMDDTMTGMHTKLKREDFKAELEAGGDGALELFRGVLQGILEEEMTAALCATKSERTSGRLGYRSGYCKRQLTTRVGQIELRVPQDRNGVFSTDLFERYERSENRPSGLRCRERVGLDANASSRGFDPEGREGDGGALRPRLFGFDGEPDQCEAGCGSEAIRGAVSGGFVSVCDSRRPLREGARDGRGSRPVRS